MRNNFLARPKGLLLFLLVLYCSNIFGQTQFYSETDNKEVGKNDYIQVQFTVKNARNVNQITPPSFNNFTIISGPAQQSGMNIVNGAVSQYQSIVFILQPKSIGTFTIASAIAIADGKQYHSAPLTIRVISHSVNNAPPPGIFPFSFDEPVAPAVHEYDDYILKKGESVAEKIKKNVFVKLEVSKTSCFIGEPIVATYKLYSRLRSESNITKTPSFNGFSVNEIGNPNGYNLNSEKVNGRDYNVYLLRKVELYPLQSGKVELESLEVENKITFIEDITNKSMDNMQRLLQSLSNGTSGSDGLIEQTVTLKNKPVIIDVKPLPKTDDPSFKGVVGTFSINSALSQSTIYQEDGGSLIVTITGAGNIQLINAPKITWPKGIDGFEPVSSEKIDKSAVPINGEKTFKFPFTVSKTGVYQIPPVSYTFFDIGTKSYKTIQTQPLDLNVKEGIGHRAATNVIPDNNSFSGSVWILIVGAAMLAFMVVLFVFNEKRNRTSPPPSPSNTNPESSTPVSQKYQPLHGLEVLLYDTNGQQFYISFKEKLLQFIAVKFGIPQSEITRKKINEVLDKKMIANSTILALNELLDDIDLHLYSASAPSSEMQMAYEKGMQIVQLLEKQTA